MWSSAVEKKSYSSFANKDLHGKSKINSVKKMQPVGIEPWPLGFYSDALLTIYEDGEWGEGGEIESGGEGYPTLSEGMGVVPYHGCGLGRDEVTNPTFTWWSRRSSSC